MIEIAGCIIEKNKKILLLHKIDKNWWELPSGKVEKGETPEETAIRETKEEIGCRVAVEKYIGYEDFKLKGRAMKSHQFKAKILEGCPSIKESKKFDRIKFINIHKTKERLAPNIKNELKENKDED